MGPTKQKFSVKVTIELDGYTVETFKEKEQDAYKESLAFLMQTSKRFVIILSVRPAKTVRRLLNVLTDDKDKYKYASASKENNYEKINITGLSIGRPRRRQLKQNVDSSSAGISVETDIQQLPGDTAVAVSERVVQVLSSPETSKIIARIFEENNVTAPSELKFDESGVTVEEIIVPVVVDPWAWMDPRFKRVSKNIGGGDIGLGFGIIVACGS